MNPNKLLNQLEKLAIDNSPLILTAVGAVGSLTTAYWTGKATFKAAKIIADEEFRQKAVVEKGHPLTRNEKIGLVWKVYILPAGSAAFTVTAIIASNRISARRAAALVAGYSLLEGRFDEYKEKVREKLGIQKEEKARDELAQDRVDKNPPPSTVIISSGKSLFKDEPSGRYFESTMEDIKRAMNEINYQIISKEYAVLTDFYERVGLAPTSLSEEFGWDITNERMEITFSTVITQDQRPCICMDYNIHPVRNGYSAPTSSRKIHAL